MEATAKARFVKTAPRKIRIVASLIRGKDVSEALEILTYLRKTAARPVKTLLESAIANAKQKSSAVDVDSLYIKELMVDMGPSSHMRRWRPRAMGRATRIVKGMSHINLTLGIR